MGSKGPKPPKALDVWKYVDAQGRINDDAFNRTIDANRFNQESPFGSLKWRGDTMVTSLNPQLQSAYDQMFKSLPQMGARFNQTLKGGSGGVESLGLPKFDASQFGMFQPTPTTEITSQPVQMPLGRLPKIGGGGVTAQQIDKLNLPTADQFAGEGAKLEKATYDRARMLLDPSQQQAQQRLQNRLATQGITMGSEAYGGDWDRLRRSQGEQDLAAALESVGAGRQEQSRLFQQALAGESAQADVARANQAANLAAGQTNASNRLQAGQANLNALMQQQQMGLNTQLANQDMGLRTQLANQQGDQFMNQLRLGAQSDFGDRQLAMRQQQLAEALAPRELGLREIQGLGGLYGGLLGNLPQPQFAQTNYQYPGVDLMGPIGLRQNQLMQNYQIGQENNSSMLGGLFGLGGSLGSAAIMAGMLSMRDLKADYGVVEQLGALPVHAWRYNDPMLDTVTVQVGPMADDWKHLYGGDGYTVPTNWRELWAAK